MTPNDYLNKCTFGDSRVVLREMKDAGVKVQAIICSPPYYRLRDYQTARWTGGDPACDHRSDTMRISRNENRPMLAGSPATNSAQLIRYANVPCGKCGAILIDHQVGIEPSVQQYIANLVEIFQLARDVLVPNGNCYINIGDSFNGSGGSGGEYGPNGKRAGQPKVKGVRIPGLKPKDLIGIPWMLAFALRDSGWWLRADNIWAKGVSGQKELIQQTLSACLTEGVSPEQATRIVSHLDPYIGNGRMESVKDRTTISHEYVFHFTKSAKYYYDQDAIAEKMPEYSVARYQRAIDNHEVFDETRHKNTAPSQNQAPMKILTRGAKRATQKQTRNRRSVWCIPTGNYYGAHFATYPVALIEPLILATSRPGDTILDPFMGSGTTAEACEKLQRNWIGIELNEKNNGLIKDRLKQRTLFTGEIHP